MNSGVRTFMLVALLVALPVASYIWMFKPRSQETARLREELRHKKEEVSMVAAQLGESGILEETRKLKQALELFKQKLPESKELEKVILEICQIAKANGLTVKSFQALETVNREGYGEQTIRWKITGPFKPNYTAFLNKLENLPRITRINEMKVDADEKVTGTVNADFTLTIFFENSKTVAVAQ